VDVVSSPARVDDDGVGRGERPTGDDEDELCETKHVCWGAGTARTDQGFSGPGVRGRMRIRMELSSEGSRGERERACRLVVDRYVLDAGSAAGGGGGNQHLRAGGLSLVRPGGLNKVYALIVKGHVANWPLDGGAPARRARQRGAGGWAASACQLLRANATRWLWSGQRIQRGLAY
jgi:hypothetical protein